METINTGSHQSILPFSIRKIYDCIFDVGKDKTRTKEKKNIKLKIKYVD